MHFRKRLRVGVAMVDTIAPMDPHDLYGLPLERFTAERNGLAKELRREGRRDDAARVAAMRKPSVGAWAVNQLVRTQRRQVDGLLKAGDALQRAQSELVGGHGDSATLRQASEREREAVDRLAGKAQGLLSSEGRELSRATLDRVSETLHAAALDEDARARVKDGCLVEELRHVGLGGLGDVAAPKSGGRRTAVKAPSRPNAAERKRAERIEAARKAEDEARRELERASKEIEDAERRRDRAAESLREAEAAVSEALRRGS
jgi:hypothetical protein